MRQGVHGEMVHVLATALAVLAAVLMVVAVVAMTAGDLQVAGLLFFSASLVLFFRDTRVLPDDPEDG